MEVSRPPERDPVTRYAFVSFLCLFPFPLFLPSYPLRYRRIVVERASSRLNLIGKKRKKEIHVSRHSPHILAALRIVFVPGTGGRVSAATFRPPCDAVFISVGVESIRVYSWTSGYCKMARYGMTRIKRV